MNDRPTAVPQVDVDTRQDGSLLVRWTFEGDPVAVELASGPGPERSDRPDPAPAL